MLKRRVYILILSFTYAILLGHNIIPHHHHDHDHNFAIHTDHKHEHTAHQYADHHHEGHEDAEGLGYLFSHLSHSDEVFTVGTIQKIADTNAEQEHSFLNGAPSLFMGGGKPFLTLPEKPPARQFYYISPHILALGLRAPPAIIA